MPRLAPPLLLALLAAAAAAGPGLRYAEVMPGALTPGRADHVLTPDSRRATLRVEGRVADFEAFMADPDHPMALTGSLRFRGGPALPATGSLRFMAEGPDPGTRRTEYRLEVQEGGRTRYLRGTKVIHDDPGFDMSADLLDLPVTLRRGSFEGPVLASGVFRVEAEKPWVLARFLASFRVPGASGWRERVSVLWRYLGLYLGALREVYFRRRPGGPRVREGAARDPGTPPPTG